MTDPICPKCESEMILKTAKRGHNAGGQFYSCSQFPKCRGTQPYGGDSVGDPVGDGPTKADAIRTRVIWDDASSIMRDGWHAWTVPVGGGFRAFPLESIAQELSRATWVAVSAVNSFEPVDTDSVRVCSMIKKLLQRGESAPIHPELEREVLRHLGTAVDGGSSDQDLAPKLDPKTVAKFSRIKFPPMRPEVLDHELAMDSDEETFFFTETVPKILGPNAARWFLPQASLDSLLAGLGSGTATGGQRRVDFAVVVPGQRTFVVEIDGQQHDIAAGVDAARDEQLAEAKIDVVRIAASEIHQGKGPGLERLKERYIPPDFGELVDKHRLLLAPAQINRLALALITAVEQGFLLGRRWVLEIDDELKVTQAALSPVLGLIAAVDDLWGRIIAPDEVWVRTDSRVLRYERREAGYKAQVADKMPELDVSLVLDISASPNEQLPQRTKTPTVVIRPAVLPVEIRMDAFSTDQRVPVKSEARDTSEALTYLLAWLFARPHFREGQLEAISELLQNRDAVVLLPTGAGKSLIYQLAGLLLPGITLIIDPIVALMENQARGLLSQGIDRVISITSYQVQLGNREELLNRVGAGDAHFIFIAPERLQQTAFRSSLQQLSATTMINLAVADEAHCISEWGHDFRTAYLRIGPLIRRLSVDSAGNPPPILALTGTASRSVLRDVLFELDIDGGANSNTTIRPETFDRKELKFTISVGDPTTAESRLKSAVQAVPKNFKNSQGFFRPNGEKSNCGIVFTPHVNGSYGVADVAQMLSPIVGSRPTVYSGSAPKKFGLQSKVWDGEKRINAEAFLSNQVTTLVATKSFGMGIDKPNVRWIVHYGIPGSIEAYYQEAGRAGRDGKAAHCSIVFSEYTEERSRQLLNPDADIENARLVADAVSRSDGDDVTRMLWFYFNSFAGLEAELATLAQVRGELGDVASLKIVEIPFSKGKIDEEQRERALHRLVLLGVVTDYTVEHGSKKFGVRLEPTSAAGVVAALVRYVERTQPARAATLSSQLAEVSSGHITNAVEACARELMRFVYDTIAASRLRSLREMWLAARQGDGDELRRRILDYFDEGSGAPTLESLLDQRPFRFSSWIEALDLVQLPDDATEWRGASARLLVSEPEHPGLLLVRAVAEEFLQDGSSAEFGSNLSLAFESAVTRYDVPIDDVLALAFTLSDLLGSDPRVAYAKRNDVPLIISALRRVASTEIVDEFVQAHEPTTDNELSYLAPIFLATQLSKVSETLRLTFDAMSATEKSEQAERIIDA